MKSKVLTLVKILVTVCCVLKCCSVVGGHQQLGGAYLIPLLARNEFIGYIPMCLGIFTFFKFCIDVSRPTHSSEKVGVAESHMYFTIEVHRTDPVLITIYLNEMFCSFPQS
jgi:hypothetical protein